MPLNDLFFLSIKLITLVPPQILHFLRIDLSVARRSVMSVVFADVARYLTHSVTSVRKALINGKFGLVNIAKDFLSPDSSAVHVARGTNSHRRKCDIIFLDCLPKDIVTKLRSSKLFLLHETCMYTYVCF